MRIAAICESGYMGTFRVEIAVGHPRGGDLHPVSALVDTGATHSMMPESLLTALRLTPLRRRGFRIANGSRAVYGVGEAPFSIQGQVQTCPVIFGPEDKYLLGAATLENFDLVVDPSTPNPRLIPLEELDL